MFKNIGSKIKTLTEIIFGCEIVLFAILGIVTAVEAENFFIFIVTAGLGFLISWISCFLLYAIGEIVENSTLTKGLIVQQNYILNNLSEKLNTSNEKETQQNIILNDIKTILLQNRTIEKGTKK